MGGKRTEDQTTSTEKTYAVADPDPVTVDENEGFYNIANVANAANVAVGFSDYLLDGLAPKKVPKKVPKKITSPSQKQGDEEMQCDDRSESFTRALFADGSPPAAQPSKSSTSCGLPQTQTQPPAQRTSS
ncbi:hypothetical protein TrLO_g5901 [Triparma laevis f. longispina]|nr:hypothetical protein TrLO_g5901 [Triparma laevis f. longispina]